MADLTDNTVLTARQYNAIAALLSEPTVRKAAEVAKVSERTMYNWLKLRTFATEYRSARREATMQATARAQQYSGSMVGILVGIAGDSKKPPAARIAAASKVLDIAIKSVELEDLEARLQALEEKYAQNVHR
jgi:tryptophan 2,3-dioxygenase